jgi:hypothetical protein
MLDAFSLWRETGLDMDKGVILMNEKLEMIKSEIQNDPLYRVAVRKSPNSSGVILVEEKDKIDHGVVVSHSNGIATNVTDYYAALLSGNKNFIDTYDYHYTHDRKQINILSSDGVNLPFWIRDGASPISRNVDAGEVVVPSIRRPQNSAVSALQGLPAVLIEETIVVSIDNALSNGGTSVLFAGEAIGELNALTTPHEYTIRPRIGLSEENVLTFTWAGGTGPITILSGDFVKYFNIQYFRQMRPLFLFRGTVISGTLKMPDHIDPDVVSVGTKVNMYAVNNEHNSLKEQEVTVNNAGVLTLEGNEDDGKSYWVCNVPDIPEQYHQKLLVALGGQKNDEK